MGLIDDTLNSGIRQAVGNEIVSAGVSVVRSVLPQVSVMMALGLFVFGLDTLPYQQLQRQTQWRHPSVPRVGRRPARQFTGPGDETITLSGVLYPEITGGKVSLDLVRALADTGKAWPLVQGDGTFYGHFVVESIDETASVFFPDGRARKIEFSLKLTRVDDAAIDTFGTATRALLALI